MKRSKHDADIRGSLVRRVLLGLAFLIALIFFLNDRYDKSQFAKARNITESSSRSVLRFLNIPIHGIQSLSQDIGAYFNVRQENKRLKAELLLLKELNLRTQALEVQNRRLGQLLDVDLNAQALTQKIVARAVGETRGPFAEAALIDVGQQKGVRPGYAVMSVNGLYGRVIRSSQSSSRVLLITDFNSRIAVMSERSGARAILTGNNTDRPRLDFVGEETDWQTGDRVVTSGDAGAFPQGLAVGIVDGRKNGKWQVIADYTHSAVDWVWVFPYDPTQAPEASNQSSIGVNLEPNALTTVDENQDNETPADVTDLDDGGL